MKKTSIIKILSSITLISLLGCISGITYAWFNTSDNVDFTKALDGDSNGAYYASGDGSMNSPYEINKPIHLYNLAWLQYIGNYNKDKDNDGKYDDFYFTVTSDLDMTGYTLPPIGTDDNPFVGNFTANNHTISNLTVSNTFSDFGNRHPYSVTSENFTSPEIIGFFGVVGLLSTKTYSYTNATASSVTQLYLDNITVKNGVTNGTLAGFLAGYVNSSITNCGVHYCNFDFVSGTTNISSLSENVSTYSYIGAINGDDYKIDGDPSGDDGGYGSSTDLYSLYKELGDKDGSEISSDIAIPFRKASDNKITTSGTKSLQLTIGNGYSPSDSNKVDVSYVTTTYSSSNSNIGYYVGNGLKMYKIGTDFISSDDYINDSNYLKSLSGTQGYQWNKYLKTPSSDITDYLTSNVTGSSDIIGQYMLRFSSGLSGTWYTNKNNFRVIKNAKTISHSGDILVPIRCIYVAPVEDGKFKFLLYNKNVGTNCSFYFYQVQRYQEGDYNGDYTAPFYRTSFSNPDDSILTFSTKFAYFEYQISTQYEYLFAMVSGSEAPYVAYMDIGAEGSGTTTTKTTLTVDFVWSSSTSDVVSLIKITDTAYVKSEVFIEVVTSDTTSKQSYFYFKRIKPTNEDQSNAFTSYVYYYVDAGGLTVDTTNTTTGHAIEKDSVNAVKNG